VGTHLHDGIRKIDAGRTGIGAGAAGGARPEFVLGNKFFRRFVFTAVRKRVLKLQHDVLRIKRGSHFDCRADSGAAGALCAGSKIQTFFPGELLHLGNTESFLLFNVVNLRGGTHRFELLLKDVPGGLEHMREEVKRDRRNESEGANAVNPPEDQMSGFQLFGRDTGEERGSDEVAHKGPASPCRFLSGKTESLEEEARNDDEGERPDQHCETGRGFK